MEQPWHVLDKQSTRQLHAQFLTAAARPLAAGVGRKIRFETLRCLRHRILQGLGQRHGAAFGHRDIEGWFTERVSSRVEVPVPYALVGGRQASADALVQGIRCAPQSRGTGRVTVRAPLPERSSRSRPYCRTVSRKRYRRTPAACSSTTTRDLPTRFDSRSTICAFLMVPPLHTSSGGPRS